MVVMLRQGATPGCTDGRRVDGGGCFFGVLVGHTTQEVIRKEVCSGDGPVIMMARLAEIADEAEVGMVGGLGVPILPSRVRVSIALAPVGFGGGVPRADGDGSVARLGFFFGAPPRRRAALGRRWRRPGGAHRWISSRGNRRNC